MKICFTCITCKELSKIKTLANTRSELEREKNEVFQANCNECGRMQAAHVNRTRAYENKSSWIIGIAIGGIMTAVLWLMFGALALITFAIPIIFVRQQQMAVSAYNRYFVTETMERT